MTAVPLAVNAAISRIEELAPRFGAAKASRIYIDEYLKNCSKPHEDQAAYLVTLQELRSAVEEEETLRLYISAAHAVLDAHRYDGTQCGEEQQAPVKLRASKRCPATFDPGDISAWAHTETPNVNVSAELAKFRDYTFSAPRSDWHATFRNWLRTAQQNASRRPWRDEKTSKWMAFDYVDNMQAGNAPVGIR